MSPRYFPHSERGPLFKWSLPLWDLGETAAPGVPRKETPGEKQELALPPRAGCADNNGGKCLSRTGFSRARQLRFSDQVTTSTPAGTAPRPGPARTRQGGRQGSGVLGGPARPTVPPHAEPTVSQQPASGRRGCLGASHLGGTQGAPGSSGRPVPPARPPSHTQ